MISFLNIQFVLQENIQIKVLDTGFFLRRKIFQRDAKTYDLHILLLLLLFESNQAPSPSILMILYIQVGREVCLVYI